MFKLLYSDTNLLSGAVSDLVTPVIANITQSQLVIYWSYISLMWQLSCDQDHHYSEEYPSIINIPYHLDQSEVDKT